MVERNSGVLATKDEVRVSFSIFFFLVRSKRLLNGTIREENVTNRYWVYYYY